MARIKQIDNQENNLEAGGSTGLADPSGGAQPVEEPVQEDEAKQEMPLPPHVHDQVVYYSRFGGKASTAFVSGLNKDGTVDLIALVAGETPPCMWERGVPYGKENRPGVWNWGV